MVLYDTADTLTQKAHLARQAGFQGRGAEKRIAGHRDEAPSPPGTRSRIPRRGSIVPALVGADAHIGPPQASPW